MFYGSKIMQLLQFSRGGSRRLRCLGSSHPAGSSARRKPNTASSTDATTAQSQKQQKARLPSASRLARLSNHKPAPSARMRQPDQLPRPAVSDRLLWEPEKVMAPFAGQRGPLRFQGDVRFANLRQQAIGWLDELLLYAATSPYAIVVGCDTETPATYTRGVHKKTALLQLCYHSAQQDMLICLLIPLNRLGVLPQVCQVLSHANIIKTGLGLAADIFQLQRDYQSAAITHVQNLLDLSWLAHACYTPKPPSDAKLKAMQLAQQQGLDIPQGNQESWGLAGLLECVSEYTLSKSRRIRCSNWAQYPLSYEQTAYAAADAYAGLVVYHSLQLKWLQVQQEQQPVGMGQSRNASNRSNNGIDTGQDVLAMFVDEVVNGNDWDAAVGSATRAAVPKQKMPLQHYANKAEDKNQPLQSLQRSDTPAEMQYTWPVEQLVNQHLWGSYRPAARRLQAWEEQIVRVGLKATQQQLNKAKSNQAEKLDAAVIAWGASLNSITPPAM